jgi:hypothetical protein
MIKTKMRQLLISRTPQDEGLIYEAVSLSDDFSLKVQLYSEKKPLFAGVSRVSGWLLTFDAPTESLQALVHQNNLTVDFYSLKGEPKGRVREAAISLAGKSIVENEVKQVVGWINWGLQKDFFYSEENSEIGFVKRASTKGLPMFLPPSKGHLVNRFELFHELTRKFDNRLIYAWICRKIWQEHDSSAS